MSVIKRGNTWYVTFWYQDPVTGQRKRFRRSTGLAAKGEAKTLEAKWRVEVTTPPKPVEPTRKAATFSWFADHWHRVHVVTNCKPSTVDLYERFLGAHLVPAFGDQNLRLISPEDVEHFKARALASSVGPGTTNTLLKVLRGLFSCAVRWGYCERNPCAGVRMLATEDRMSFWTREEAARFLDAVHPKWHAIFATALLTGLRRGELLGLEWSDIDWDRQRLHVQRTWDGTRLQTPKSGRARFVPMPSKLVPILRQHPRRLDSPVVFPARSGERSRSVRDLIKVLKREIKRAEVPEIRLHDLRHTYASHLVMAGVPLRAVQEYLGHASITTTMKYAHLSPEARDSYVEALSVPIGPKMDPGARTQEG